MSGASDFIELITFDSANDRIVLLMNNGAEIVFTRSQADDYLQLTGRAADIIAMGWINV